MEPKQHPLPLIAIVALLLIAGAVFLYRSKSGIEVVSPTPPPSASESLGEKIYEQAQNPIKDQVPQTNPFETKANPFETEVNPFQGVYKNPFR